ncbi:hemerythrin domain-containing protein [Salinisphaera sp. SPP-AMP-43]|uniref:hemerythrin domain-containing protein n=1 Tax=Salinisphaera sp. SPP-AMP-43 TaxID=3121288 RepID=UPI003C6DF33D
MAQSSRDRYREGVNEIPEKLRLGNRDRLPAEIAFLRERYPSSGWTVHSNYGELSAFWLSVHERLKAQGHALQQAIREFREGAEQAAVFRQRFMPRLGEYLQHVEGHHQIEDRHYFPRFRRLDRRMVAGFELLENDHDIIHERLVASADSARALMDALARDRDSARRAADAFAARADRLLILLDQHLDDEEDLVIPAMLEHGERPLR